MSARTLAERRLWVVDFAPGARVRAYSLCPGQTHIAVEIGRPRMSEHSVRLSAPNALVLADQLRFQALAAEAAGMVDVAFSLDVEPQHGVVNESRVPVTWLAALAQAIREVVAEAERGERP